MFFTYLLYIQASSFEPKETTDNFTKPKYFYNNVPGIYEVELPPGLYKVTCCGAQGGVSYNRSSYGNCGGYGACVSGYMNVNGSNQIFYAVIGGMGGSKPKGFAAGGFNGGGNSGKCINYHYHLYNKQYINGPGGGGGATDLRYMNNAVSNRIIVAAGGSGASVNLKGADGGDINGRNYYGITTRTSQVSGNSTGQGSNGLGNLKFFPSSGAGGGYRGGLPGIPSDDDAAGAVSDSGSSYISGYPGCNLYKYFNFTEGEMRVGANTGNGYLVIDQKYPCSSHCIHCLNGTECLVCEEGYRLYNGVCLEYCPFGVIDRETYCESCVPECSSCSGYIDNCSSCNYGYYLFNNKCYQLCPIGTYENGIICSECSSICEECKDNANKCTKCAKGMYLFDSNCTEKCPDDYSIYNDECVEKCPKGFYVDDNICVEHCPVGKYDNDGLCEKCDSSCATCQYFPTECTSCNENMFLFEDQCITECPNSTLIFKNKCVSECPEGYIPVLDVCEEDSIINYVFIERHEKKSKYSLKKINYLIYTSIEIFAIEVIVFITIGICYYKKSNELQ